MYNYKIIKKIYVKPKNKKYYLRGLSKTKNYINLVMKNIKHKLD